MTEYKNASIDIHKRVLNVVAADVMHVGEYEFIRFQAGTSPMELRRMADWMIAQNVQEIVGESTAQYWRPVWEALECYWQPVCRQQPDAGPAAGALHLAQAKSNRAPRGRKNDFADAERLLTRLVANELTLSFVPSPEQRLWRTVTHRKHQLGVDRVRLQNQLESFLEEAHIKLSSVVSNLLGVSGRRMLHGLAEGETNPAVLAAMADGQLRATQAQLSDVLSMAATLHPVYRSLLKMTLQELKVIEEHIDALDREMATLLAKHQDAVLRLAEVPGLGINSAQQIIAEIGPAAAVFPSEKHLASWVGVCPGEEESAGVSKSSRSPKGNKTMRRVLNQAANAAVKAKGSIFQVKFQHLRKSIGYKHAIWAIAHRICRLVWKLLHLGIHYEERGPAVTEKAKRVRTNRNIRELRKLGYTVLPPVPVSVPS